jgi:hypothetical protein
MTFLSDQMLSKQESQTFLERWIIRPLLAIRSVSPPTATLLPPEIWKTIFDYILDELCHPYQQCDWLTFPTYHRDIEASIATGTTDWKNYRLVCRTFAEILNTPIQLRVVSANSPISDGVKILHVRQTLSTVDPTLGFISSLSQCRSITTLTLEQKRWDRGESVSWLMSGSRTLPKLRSLRLFTGLPYYFWKHLEKSFPSLIELYIGSAPPCDARVTLWKLEILHVIDIDKESLLHCPQLKHLFIKSHPGWDGFLQRHATHLESLLIQSRVSHHPDMPSCFPNLRTYGEAVSYHPSSIFDPQSDVCLAEHLCLYWSGLKHVPSISIDAAKVISKTTRVRFITMDPCIMSSVEANPLVRACRKKGGQFSWLTPRENPTGFSYFREFVEFYWLWYTIESPRWLIDVLLTPFYCVSLMIYIPLIILGREPYPFAGDYLYMRRGE